MAENRLEGFEDFDSVLGDESEGESPDLGGDEPSGGDEADFAGELDDLLGDSGGGGGDDLGGADADAGDGDSELDSFFEDLSTIDDLEVLQEDEPAPEVGEPAGEDEDVFDDAPAAAAAAAPAAAAAAEPRSARQPRERKKRGFFGRLIRWIILLALLGGGGYYLYTFLFPDAEPPWQVMEQEKDRLMKVIEEQLNKPPPPDEPPPPVMRPIPPPPVAQPAPRPAARPAPPVKPTGPPPERGPWSIQVATCFFPSCLDSYRSYLQANKRSILLRDKASQSESLEIYSISTWREREEAQELSDRVNREHPMEGHAYIFREGGGYRISMGAFADLERANIVKDALNQQYRGEIAFATRVKAFPYKLQSVLTGRYPTRAAAEKALAELKDAEPRLKDAFVTRN